jgi:hypothetical protein
LQQPSPLFTAAGGRTGVLLLAIAFKGKRSSASAACVFEQRKALRNKSSHLVS